MEEINFEEIRQKENEEKVAFMITTVFIIYQIILIVYKIVYNEIHWVMVFIPLYIFITIMIVVAQGKTK
ncbi:MAG: hypothetical protein ACOCRX_08940 [Candidatus Woesearchaeota archaeon]